MINLALLKNISAADKYPEGAVISDSMHAQMHIILKGKVGLYSRCTTAREKQLCALGPGEFYGETALFLGREMAETAVALTDVIVLPVHRNFAAAFIKSEPEICYEIMRLLCGRVYDEAAPAGTNEEGATAPPAAPLFPEGHGDYKLPLPEPDRKLLMEKSFCCPVCKKSFKVTKVRPSKLITDRIDPDMRVRYKGIEPLYYDVTTCPDCLYSAPDELFESPDKPCPGLPRELRAFNAEAGALSADASPLSVFAGYYLALYCAPRCFRSPHLTTAKLHLKLSWLYQDCGDVPMAEKTARQALDAYIYVFQNIENPPKADQQLCMVIGELYLKLGDTRNAKVYLFKAQSNREGLPNLRSKAADRIADVRAMEAAAQEPSQ